MIYLNIGIIIYDVNYNLLPLLAPFLLVPSVGIGVTSSTLPILKPIVRKY